MIRLTNAPPFFPAAGRGIGVPARVLTSEHPSSDFAVNWLNIAQSPEIMGAILFAAGLTGHAALQRLPMP